VKKVVQDPHYKNRELDVLLRLNHSNYIRLIKSFSICEGVPVQIYLYTVSDIFPTDLSHYAKAIGAIPDSLFHLFGYQFVRRLSILDSIGICHRDIKPTNVLIDPAIGRMQLCDCGSAKPSRRAALRFHEIWIPNRRLIGGVCACSLPNGGGPLFWRHVGPPGRAGMCVYDTNKTFRPAAAFSAPIDDTLLDLLGRIFVSSERPRPTAEECKKHCRFCRSRLRM
jgi:serine/threonine protein kinase